MWVPALYKIMAVPVHKISRETRGTAVWGEPWPALIFWIVMHSSDYLHWASVWPLPTSDLEVDQPAEPSGPSLLVPGLGGSPTTQIFPAVVPPLLWKSPLLPWPGLTTSLRLLLPSRPVTSTYQGSGSSWHPCYGYRGWAQLRTCQIRTLGLHPGPTSMWCVCRLTLRSTGLELTDFSWK